MVNLIKTSKGLTLGVILALTIQLSWGFLYVSDKGNDFPRIGRRSLTLAGKLQRPLANQHALHSSHRATVLSSAKRSNHVTWNELSKLLDSGHRGDKGHSPQESSDGRGRLFNSAAITSPVARMKDSAFRRLPEVDYNAREGKAIPAMPGGSNSLRSRPLSTLAEFEPLARSSERFDNVIALLDRNGLMDLWRRTNAREPHRYPEDQSNNPEAFSSRTQLADFPDWSPLNLPAADEEISMDDVTERKFRKSTDIDDVIAALGSRGKGGPSPDVISLTMYDEKRLGLPGSGSGNH